MNMQLTPHFNYTGKYDTIRCPCRRCRDDEEVRIDISILWVAEAIRAALNSRCREQDEIMLKVNSGARCVKHHVDIYKKMGVAEDKIPYNSCHLIWPSKPVATALEITPISKLGIISTRQLLDEVDDMLGKDWPGGFHRYATFFYIDLGGEKRRWPEKI